MKKKIKIGIAIGLGTTLALLFIVLSIHLYAIEKKKQENPTAKLQLSRIDFKEKVDSIDAMHIKHYVLSLPEIRGAHFNIAQSTLVYGYTSGTIQPQHIYEKVMQFSKNKYKAERYVVSAEALKQGCPAGMNNSLTKRYSEFLYLSFN